jgi:hypothetical protein
MATEQPINDVRTRPYWVMNVCIVVHRPDGGGVTVAVRPGKAGDFR